LGSVLATPQTSDSKPHSVRILGLWVDILTIRLAIGIVLLIIVPLSIGLYALSQNQFNRGLEARKRAVESENRILEVVLRHQMIHRDNALMTEILHEVAAHPEVRDIMIVNHDGEVRISSNTSRVGEQIDRSSQTCLVCHARDPANRERWVIFRGDQEDILRAVQPIVNRPECYQCHDSQARFNGMLLLDLSLSQLQAQMDQDRATILSAAVVLAFLLVAGVGLLVRSLILKRLIRFSRVARSIAAGNLTERVSERGDDVIATLAVDFNEMAHSVAALINEVREQEAQLASVMDSLDDGLIVLDREGRVVACNLSFSRRMNVSPSELQGSRCRDAVAGALPCCQLGHECPASRCVATGEVQREIIRIPSSGGEEESVEEVYASPIFNTEGEVIQVVELWRDITARVKEEERLAEIERLVSLGILASGFSHEVNTPLASMLTCAETVIERIDESDDDGGVPDLLPDIREAAEIIRKQVLRCRRITEQFLSFSRGVPPTVEPVDLVPHVTEAISLVVPTAREDGIELRFEPPSAIPIVSANTEVIQHVMLNLLVNAIQSCGSEGGRIDVSIEDGNEVRVFIKDSGCGIHPEDRKHLFEPFRSHKPSGTGLGLFLSRTFMRRFGGDVRLLESQPGVGSCFEICFRRDVEVAL